MTLQQAAAGVRGIDAAMLRQVERPHRMYRREQRDVVDHVWLRREETSSDANSSHRRKFLLFPGKTGSYDSLGIGPRLDRLRKPWNSPLRHSAHHGSRGPDYP